MTYCTYLYDFYFLIFLFTFQGEAKAAKRGKERKTQDGQR